ncbi:hypothetical protein JDV02_005189 [Purpureocillium takamizusanense]|uniref:Centromere/microtubule binding protein cbf5-like protein n=1 Tax=Purpureocillium takamizusanense TaxID=2060973 RepID=A0A9Q8QG12_9HYPO|nr:uncharacterized protein JDV02_005189 [Purpureocillium takamizusanense]UNI18960.1 hypothetical protein JDV02_005189 [Purpureocillium takamizusanense]
MRRLSLDIAVSLALPAAQAILVAPGSPCSTNCGNVLDSTSPADLVCSEKSYASPAGQLFQGCVQCELQSSFHRDNKSDVESMLYNLRYTVSYCLFGRPENKNIVNTPCVTSKACGGFRDSVGWKNLSTEYQSYEYCERWPPGDPLDLQGCTECLQAEERYYLANFMTALQAGCRQRPQPGIVLGLEGTLFSDDRVNVTAPSPTAVVDPAWFDQGPLNLGAKVGIAVGGFVLLISVIGCAIILNGKRKRKAFLRNLETQFPQKTWPSPISPRRADMSEAATNQQHVRAGWDDTPLSQQPLRGWDESPMTGNTDKSFPRFYSPYSSQFNSPVSAHDNLNPKLQMPLAALGITEDIGVAVGGRGAEAEGPWVGSPSDPKGKGPEEAYELKNVDAQDEGGSSGAGRMPQAEPPVLSHPGYGRSSTSSQRPHNLTEQDARNGSAI